jgi:hypothetical protein
MCSVYTVLRQSASRSEADRADTISKADRVKQVEYEADRKKQVELKYLRLLYPMGREAKQHQLVQHRLLVAEQLTISSVLYQSLVAQRQLEQMGGQ